MIGRDTLPARLLFAAAVAIAASAAGACPEHAALDRGAVLDGELWRLWTGHFVHGSRAHFSYDVGAAMLLAVAFRPALWLAWMAPLVSVILLAALPDLHSYYGLSGLLHAWVVVCATEVLERERGLRAWLAVALALGTVGKAAIETWVGVAVLTAGLDFGGPVIHASHLVGSLVGGLPYIARRVSAAGARGVRAHLGHIGRAPGRGTARSPDRRGASEVGPV